MPNSVKETRLIHYQYPKSYAKSKKIKLNINGESVTVLESERCCYACISFEGFLEVKIEAENNISNVSISPLSKGIVGDIQGNAVCFSIDHPCSLSIQISGELPVYLFANPLEKEIPSMDDPKVHFFKAGQVYEVGELRLGDNETLYIEGGAVVKGCLRATRAHHVKVCGRGIFDGSYYIGEPERRRLAVFEGCHDLLIQDIILTQPQMWMLVIGACENVNISNLKEIGDVCSSDGIDIVGSKNVVIDGCFISVNDDCVVVKSLNSPKKYDAQIEWAQNVENVVVQNCVFANGPAGNGVEIGHELRTEYVRNITFRNCDILSVHGYGAPLSIHNGDRACVSRVLFEDIRIEHFYDKLIDFRIIKSQFNTDLERGQVRDIHLKNIKVHYAACNAGYSVSVIGGYDNEHTIENVIIENLYFNEEKIEDAAQLSLYTRDAHNIVFK